MADSTVKRGKCQGKKIKFVVCMKSICKMNCNLGGRYLFSLLCTCFVSVLSSYTTFGYSITVYLSITVIILMYANFYSRKFTI